MVMFPLHERRNHIRTEYTVDVLCAIPEKAKWLDVYTAQMKNLSSRGMCLKTNDMVRPGTELYLQFCLSGYQCHFRVNTKVIWCRFDPLIQRNGVYFTDIQENFEEMLEHFVLKHYDFRSASNY